MVYAIFEQEGYQEQGGQDYADGKVVLPLIKGEYGEQSLALHRYVRGCLPVHKKHHLLEKNLDQLFPPDGVAVGYVVDKEICGFMVLRPAQSLDVARENQFLTFNNKIALPRSIYRDGPVGVIQAVCVDPDYAGTGIAGMMFEAVQGYAALMGISQLFAQTSLSNYDGWTTFLKSGFFMVSSWKSVFDGRQRVLMHKHCAEKHVFGPLEKKIDFPYRPDKHKEARNIGESNSNDLLFRVEGLLSGSLCAALKSGMAGVVSEKHASGVTLGLAKLSIM